MVCDCPIRGQRAQERRCAQTHTHTSWSPSHRQLFNVEYRLSVRQYSGVVTIQKSTDEGAHTIHVHCFLKHVQRVDMLLSSSAQQHTRHENDQECFSFHSRSVPSVLGSLWSLLSLSLSLFNLSVPPSRNRINVRRNLRRSLVAYVVVRKVLLFDGHLLPVPSTEQS